MRILITGNLGYVGSCLTRQLRQAWPHARIVGFDAGYFDHPERPVADNPDPQTDQQIVGDIREPAAGLFARTDAVIHLAALSSQSACRAFEGVAREINCTAAVEVARRARKSGVRSFVFASSASVYGDSPDGSALDERSETRARSAYGKAKADAEQSLRSLAGRDMAVTCLRFVSACGASPRMRPDTMLNNRIAGYAGAGEPASWPAPQSAVQLIHVRDMARALEWAAARPSANGGAWAAINTGSDAWTWSAGELARLVAEWLPDIETPESAASTRSSGPARLDFSLFRRLAPLHQPRENPAATVAELKAIAAWEPARTRLLAGLVGEGRLDRTLRLTAGRSSLPPEPPVGRRRAAF